MPGISTMSFVVAKHCRVAMTVLIEVKYMGLKGNRFILFYIILIVPRRYFCGDSFVLCLGV